MKLVREAPGDAGLPLPPLLVLTPTLRYGSVGMPAVSRIPAPLQAHLLLMSGIIGVPLERLLEWLLGIRSIILIVRRFLRLR